MLLLGVSAGIPLLLIFSSLSLWLREAGVDRSAVTYFSWAALGYPLNLSGHHWSIVYKFLFKPKMGRRRAWLLLSQLMIMLAISLMALIDPATNQLQLWLWLLCYLVFQPLPKILLSMPTA